MNTFENITVYKNQYVKVQSVKITGRITIAINLSSRT